MDDREIMSFRDEEGNKIDFEAVARIYIEESEYLILSPIVNGVTDEENEYIYRVDEVDGKQELNFVENDREFEAVKKEYNRLRSQL